ALLDGPVLHGVGDGVGDLRVERSAELDRLLQGLEHRLGQALALDGLAEDVLAEEVLDVDLAEVDAVELVRRAGDGLEGGVARVGGVHLAVPGETGSRCSAANRRRAARAPGRGRPGT